LPETGKEETDMNNRFLNTAAIIASCSLFVAGCGDISDLQNPNTEITPNTGTVSYNNFTILAEDLEPQIFAAPDGNTFTYHELQITVRIGDRNNNVLTDEHEVFFKTEWGLMQSPSCKTKDGTCSVTWQTGSADDAPVDHKNTIVAYTLGEESFEDANGNGIFDDGDTTFTDIEEPFVDSNRNGVYDSGEPIIDRPNGNDLSGKNGVHDIGDTFFNGGGCTHSSLCSTTINSISIWDDVQLSMDGPVTP